MLNKKALSSTAQAAAGATYVEDVFSTYLYNGNGSTQTITNDIDLSGEGGMVWIKARSTTEPGALFNTVRGATYYLRPSSTNAEGTLSGITAFNSNGFTLGDYPYFNDSGVPNVSWTFRKAAKFFDVVTYTGTGTNRTISHNLGSTPGCIIVKGTSTATPWCVYHRGLTSASYFLYLNSTAYQDTSSTYWNNTAPTSSVFSLGSSSDVNENGQTYVAYVFAHNAGGFGLNNDQSIISCGSYTGNGTTPGPSVNLGWEPQWVMIKRVGTSLSTGNWFIFDNMRGLTMDQEPYLYANTADAEFSPSDYLNPAATGFDITTSASSVNASGDTYVYIAIRRGPMKTPTDATKVFTPTVYTGTNVDNRLINTTIAPDFVMIRQRDDTVVPGMYTGARLTGQQFMITASTNAGATDGDSFDQQIVSTVEYGNAFSSMSGVWVGNDATRKFNANTTSNNHIIHAFKRAPGFMDVVCYTGDGSTEQTVSHNLTVAPELYIIKQRNSTGDWWAYTTVIDGTHDYAKLNTTAAFAGSTRTSPTSTNIYPGGVLSTSSQTYIALLFASLAGVSKVGTYTGNGTSQTIDCGFTAGARYVLIKRTDSTGDWLVMDTARGITSGNDPGLWLNLTSAEAALDFIDPVNSGFEVLANAYNQNGATYIYLAIA
jgi:hypothetical protein